ncbi:MAG: hypothetical protein IPK82_37780 [Polyangiaceae bacterium]|nr:hypothetical protein [Polyangiaceae bacterium]
MGMVSLPQFTPACHGAFADGKHIFMERGFNTTGACFPDEHYMIAPERRLGKVLQLLRENKYFVLQGGNQTGKTTSLIWLENYLPTQGKRALWLDVQTARD